MTSGPGDPGKPALGGTVGRRAFLDIAIGGGVLVWAGGMLLPMLSYLWPARLGGSKVTRVSAGSAKDFPVGSARMVHASGAPLLVIRVAEDKYRAFSAICTHLGCIVKWDDTTRDIRCPCHAAVFSAEGKVVAGPPPRPLQEYPVSVSGDEVLVKL